MQKVKMKISGMHCSGCSHFISMILAEFGAKEKTVDVKSGEVSFIFDEQVHVLKDVIARINGSDSYTVAEVQLN